MAHPKKVEQLDPHQVGYLGRVADLTPNEHYTVAGVLAGKPVPETQPFEEVELAPIALHEPVKPVGEGEAKAVVAEKAAQGGRKSVAAEAESAS